MEFKIIKIEELNKAPDNVETVSTMYYVKYKILLGGFVPWWKILRWDFGLDDNPRNQTIQYFNSISEAEKAIEFHIKAHKKTHKKEIEVRHVEVDPITKEWMDVESTSRHVSGF